ncbi:hypothetical protein [Marinifilum fragile]|uniref:hypothetical protein n=1 Tax=Marinifilum fragile TaxID=570161 RepID=UPI002AAC19EF|nr:hypothetical protein [Marinifilum fragile]
MKSSLVIILLVFGLQVAGQTVVDSIVKIEIVDYENYDFDYMKGRTYELIPSKDKFIIYDMNLFTGFELLEKLKEEDNERYEWIRNKITKDLMEVFKFEMDSLKTRYFVEPDIIDSVSRDKIDSLLFELKRIPSKSIMKELKLHDELLGENALKYIELYNQTHKSNLKNPQRAYCITQLQNVEVLQKSAKELILKNALSDYRYARVSVYRQNDTLQYRTKGISYFMLPWYNEKNDMYTYNPKASILLGAIIPKDLNGDLLQGENFTKDLYFYVIDKYCLNNRGRFKRK